jgi:DNA-binding CsgD family transcriptional regulator
MRIETIERRIGEATTEEEISRTLVELAPEFWDINHCACLPLSRGAIEAQQMMGWHRDVPYYQIWDRSISIWSTMERELAYVSEYLETSGKAVLFDERFPSDYIEKTTTYERFLHHFSLEHMVVVALGSPRDPQWLLAISRDRMGRPFSRREVAMLEHVGSCVQQATIRVRHSGKFHGQVDPILNALEETIPLAAGLFDCQGRLRWLSREALVRLELEAAPVGRTFVIRGDEKPLEAMRSAVQLAASMARDASPTLHFFPQVFLDRGERLVVRRHYPSDNASPLFLLTLESIHPESSLVLSKADLSERGLSDRESDVVVMAVQGFSATNISAHLGLKESTVNTYLKRTYRKLGITTRAELAFVVLGGSVAQSN